MLCQANQHIDALELRLGMRAELSKDQVRQLDYEKLERELTTYKKANREQRQRIVDYHNQILRLEQSLEKAHALINAAVEQNNS